MINQTFRRLLIIYTVVITLIICIFAAAIYGFSLNSIGLIQGKELQAIVTSITSSIETPDEDDNAESIPDVVQNNEDLLTPGVGLEWFNEKETRVARKGKFACDLPLDKSQSTVEQSTPHSLVATRLVERKGHKLGYLRVIMSLEVFDRYRAELARNLLAAGFLTSVIGAFAVIYLVRLALQPVSESIQRLTDFTADAAHELKTPITAIQLNSDVALKYPEGMRESDQPKFELVSSAANQMSNTVEQLLLLAEVDQTSGKGHDKLVELCPIIEELLDELGPMADSARVKIRFSTSSPAVKLPGNRDLFKSMIANLVRNAIQYAGVDKLVSIGLSAGSGEARIMVEDNGAGISSEELPRVFDRFWRSDRVRNYKGGGNGLGLAIVRAIAARSGGTVSVTSKPDVATVFTVVLPLK